MGLSQHSPMLARGAFGSEVSLGGFVGKQLQLPRECNAGPAAMGDEHLADLLCRVFACPVPLQLTGHRHPRDGHHPSLRHPAHRHQGRRAARRLEAPPGSLRRPCRIEASAHPVLCPLPEWLVGSAAVRQRAFTRRWRWRTAARPDDQRHRSAWGTIRRFGGRGRQAATKCSYPFSACSATRASWVRSSLTL